MKLCSVRKMKWIIIYIGKYTIDMDNRQKTHTHTRVYVHLPPGRSDIKGLEDYQNYAKNSSIRYNGKAF